MFKIFLTFVMLGFFSFGGGYTFLPLMESELVEKLKLLTQKDFLIALTAGQISPGPVACAGSFAGFLVGYKLHNNIWMGFLYATIAWIGTNVATITCMGLIMRVYNRIANHPAISFLQLLVMPVVIGIIFYLAVKMTNTGLLTFAQLAIAIFAFLLARTRKLDYAFIIISGGIIGHFFLK